MLAFLAATAALATGHGIAHRVSFTSYGPVRIGMDLAAMQDALGAPIAAIDPEDGSTGCQYVGPAQGHEGVSFMLLDGRLARIDIDTPAVETLSGARVGSSRQDVLSIYGSRIAVTPHFYTAPEGEYLTLLSRDGKHGLRFETDHGRVTRFYMGTREAIQFVEGCA